jgi:hypothetical protein
VVAAARPGLETERAAQAARFHLISAKNNQEVQKAITACLLDFFGRSCRFSGVFSIRIGQR